MDYNFKPILSSTIDSNGVYIEDGKLFHGMELLIDPSNSNLRDIAEFKEVALSIEVIKFYLESLGFRDLINSFLIRDEGSKVLLSTGVSKGLQGIPPEYGDNTFIVAHKNEVKALLCNGDYYGGILTTILRFVQEVQTLLTSISLKYNPIKEIQDRLEFPKQILSEGNISDYVSFENTVEVIGTVYASIGFSNMTFNGMNITSPNGILRLESYIEILNYENVVKEGDIIELVIGYKDESEVISPITGQVIDYSIDSITFQNTPITFNGSNINMGIYPLFFVSSLVEVRDTTLELENKLIVEVNKDRIVVHSKTDKVKEYFIKSCRLLYKNQ